MTLCVVLYLILRTVLSVVFTTVEYAGALIAYFKFDIPDLFLLLVLLFPFSFEITFICDNSCSWFY